MENMQHSAKNKRLVQRMITNDPIDILESPIKPCECASKEDKVTRKFTSHM